MNLRYTYRFKFMHHKPLDNLFSTILGRIDATLQPFNIFVYSSQVSALLDQDFSSQTLSLIFL